MKTELETIRRGTPTRDLFRLSRRLNRMFDDILSPINLDIFGEEPFAEMEFTPSMEVQESENDYILNVDLPGVPREDVNVQVIGNQLVISGERKQEKSAEWKGAQRSERCYGSFMRTFTLPNDIEADKVEAAYRDGVLQLAIPKGESQKARRIEVKEGSEGLLHRIAGAIGGKGKVDVKTGRERAA